MQNLKSMLIIIHMVIMTRSEFVGQQLRQGFFPQKDHSLLTRSRDELNMEPIKQAYAKKATNSKLLKVFKKSQGPLTSAWAKREKRKMKYFWKQFLDREQPGSRLKRSLHQRQILLRDQSSPLLHQKHHEDAKTHLTRPGSILIDLSHQQKIRSLRKHTRSSRLLQKNLSYSSLRGKYSSHTNRTGFDQTLQVEEDKPHAKDQNQFSLQDEGHQGTSRNGQLHPGETNLTKTRQIRAAGEWSFSSEEGKELFKVYYQCLKKRLKMVKQPHFSINPLISHIGQKVRMDCHVCVNPERGMQGQVIAWQFLRRLDSTLSVLDSTRKHRITSSWTLVIREVTLLDVGQYYCTEGGEYLAVYQLDVLTAERRRTVSEKSMSELAPVKILAPNNLELYTTWTEWSQCNQCDKPGRRRKIGLCMVKKFQKGKPIKPIDFPLMEFYTGGVPCRATALPHSLSRLPAIRRRRSEILMGACEVPCPTTPPPVEITDSMGKVVEVLNPGYYSVRDKPKLPPMVKRKVQYQEAGIHLILKCPHDDEDEEDVIIRWQRGKRKIDPRTIRRQTRGRVFVDQLNKLHIKKLLVADTAAYNCWNQRRHVATIKVIVIEKFNANIKDYISYGGFILTVVAIVLTCICVCCRRGQRSGR